MTRRNAAQTAHNAPPMAKMGCFRRGLVLLMALGFFAGALVIGGAAITHGMEKGKQDDIYAGLFIGGLLLVPALILGFIGARGRYKISTDGSDLDGARMMHTFDVDIDP